MIKKIAGLAAHFRGAGIKAQMLRGVGGSAAVKVTNMVLALGTGIVLARLLGPKEYGQYSFILSLIMMLSLPTRAGLPTLLTREVAKYVQTDNWSLLKGLMRATNTLASIYAVFAVICGYLLAPILIDEITLSAFYIALTLLPLISIEQVRMGTLKGLHFITIAQLPESVIKPGIILAFLITTSLVGLEHFNIENVLIINVAATIIAVILSVFFVHKTIPTEVNNDVATYDYSGWAMSFIPLTIFAGLQLIDSQLAILFLGALSTDENVGLFKVAFIAAGMTSFGLSSVNMALAPQIVRLHKNKENKKLQHLIKLSARLSMLIAIPISIIFFLWGDILISFVFGKEFSGASKPLFILTISQLVNCGSGSVALILNMTGNEKYTVYGAVIGLVCNIILLYFLVPVLGIIGAAIGYSTSLVIWNILLVYITYKKTGLNATFLFN